MALTATNTVTAARRFDPFGNPRGTGTGAWPDARGFLHQPADTSTGLTHLGARDYDPVIGRFISVDPELDLSDPTQWNAYGYANSNPTTLSDPSGRRPEGAGDSGCGNCMLTASGTWTFGNETAGSTSVHGGTYHQSYANVQDQQSARAQNRQRRHVTETGDNVLQREAQHAAVARDRRASLIRQAVAAAHAASQRNAESPSLLDRTYGVCGNAGAGFGLWLGVSVCGGVSGGTPWVTLTPGIGLSTPSASVTGGVIFGNATKPSELTGWFGDLGFGGAIGVAVNEDYSSGYADDGKYIWTNQISGGLGLDIPAEIKGAGTYTFMLWTP
jgi:RHS repeat-associated protein